MTEVPLAVPDPDPTKAALLDTLQNQRQHILGALEGLDAAALSRPILPSGWNCLGLVQHLALDVERFWFATVMAAQPVHDRWTKASEAAWKVEHGLAPDQVLALYRDEAARADAVIAATPMEAPPLAWPEQFGDFRMADLRAVLLHVIAETATHAGHLDAARELIDGRRWMVLD
jgi:hypothetical protein